MSYQPGPVLALLCAACGSVNPGTDAPLPIDAPSGGLDAPPTNDAMASDALMPIDGPMSQARCDPTKPFGAATLVSAVSSSVDEYGFAVTRDERIGFVGRNSPAATPVILGTRRASDTAAFDAPDATTTAAINNASGSEYSPSPVADGLILYFHRQLPQGGAIGIVAASRTDSSAAFDAGSTVFVDGNALGNTLSPTISADGQTLYWLDAADFGKVFSATRDSSPTLFVNKRAASTIAIGARPVLSADELTLYYATGSGDDVLVSTRASKTESFGTGIPVANVNSAADDQPLALSHDGCVLYLSSTRTGGVGGADIWEARRPL